MPKPICVLCAAALLSIAASCSDIDFTPEGYRKAILSGLDKIPEARQFDELFGKENVDHFISYSGSLKVGSKWNSEVHFGGRYILTMQVPVRMERSFDEVVEILGEPKFYLVEVRQVRRHGSGQIGASMATDFEEKYGRFGVEEWKKIYKAQGDFAAVGIPLKNEPPVEHFDEFVAGGRRDRVQIER